MRKPSPVGHLVGYARVSTAEQDPALQDYYPDLTGDDEIVIVSFEVDHPRLPQR